MKKRELNRISKVLKDQGRSNKWLAGKLGKHVNTVSLWVNNEQQPHLDVFFQISVLLDCDILDLIVSTKSLPKTKKS